jgi:pimeloyl-ACP methyl ester carboxylesterase
MFTRTQYFSLTVILLLFVAVFTLLSPAFVNVDLFYPQRVDSLFVAAEANRLKNEPGTMDDTLDQVLFNPSSLQLSYENYDVTTRDQLLLHGWYIKTLMEEAPTLLILHDLNESKINYIDMLKQFHDRDIHVCIFDLRAHGNSEGEEFSPGMTSVNDVSVMLDSLFCLGETNNVYIMGVGIGSIIAVQAAAHDERIAGLILENSFVNYENFLENYSTKKWGNMKFLFRAPFLQKVRHQIQMDPAELDASRLLKNVRIPTLFVAGGREDFAAASESAQLKDSSAASQKELFLIQNSFHNSTAETGDEYYNRIVEFIHRTIPAKQKKSRYKKLAIQ